MVLFLAYPAIFVENIQFCFPYYCSLQNADEFTPNVATKFRKATILVT